MEKTYKRVSFDIELAKKIQSKEVEGKISGYEGIVLYDYVAELENGCIIQQRGRDIPNAYGCDGQCLDNINKDVLYIFIELPEEAPKHEFKPFDKVLVRQCDYRTPDDYEEASWLASLYSNKCICDTHKIITGKIFKQCIPYEGNEHLVGTTDKPKED